MIHPCWTWFMPHITLIYRLYIVSIPASLSLSHYTTYEEYDSSSFVPISSLGAEHVWGVVGGHMVKCKVIQTCETWLIPHITHMKWWDSIPIPGSSSLHHYTTDEISMIQALGSSNIQGNSRVCTGCSWRS